MASIGAEDLRKGASPPTLIVQAKSAVVHSSGTLASPNHFERKWYRTAAFGDSIPPPHVKGVYERPCRFSGISSQCASPSVPAGVERAQSRDSHSSTNSNSRPHSAETTRSSVHISGPSTACQSPCHLEPVIHGYQTHSHLNPLRLKSRLLGKRASAPPLSIYPPCPSPPKTSSHKASVIVEKTMPANQSYPWSRSKLRSNSNGVARSSSAKMPTIARLERKDFRRSSAPLSGERNHSQTTVPLESKFADVPQHHISNLAEYDRIVAGDVKENGHTVECCVRPETCVASQRVRKVSSEVEFTAAVRKLTKNMAHASSGTINGLSEPLMANFNARCNEREVKTGANSAAQALTTYSINGSEEFYMDTNASNALCLDEDSPSDEMTQDRIRAIPEDINLKMDSSQSPTVYSVINQISAIHLTKDCCHTLEEEPSQCPMTLDEGSRSDVRG